MKHFTLSLIFIALVQVAAFGQAASAQRLLPSSVSTLDVGNPPLGSVRYAHDALRQDGLCVTAGVGVTPIGADALKTPNGWMCTSRSGGFTPLTFVNLDTPAAGQARWVSNGLQGTAPCTAGGTGALAIGDGLQWNCPSLSSIGGGVTSVTGITPIGSTGGATPQISLLDTAVTPGAYTNSNITVDAKGRITAAANGSAGVGDVSAASNFGTDNMVVRSDGTLKGAQSTGVSVDDSDNIVVPGTVSTGDGTVAGENRLYELTANGSEYFARRGPDARSTSLVVLEPSADPLAGQIQRHSAPSSTVSTVTWAHIPYDVAVMYDGVPAASSTFRFVTATAFNSTASWAGTVCSSGTAADAQADFLVKKGASTVATLRFAAAGVTCSIVSPTTSAFAAGDVLTIVSPASPDATLANIAITLKGTVH